MRAHRRVAARPEALEQFAEQPGPEDRVGLKATGNALAIARIIRGHRIAIAAVVRKMAVLFWHLLAGERDYAYWLPTAATK